MQDLESTALQTQIFKLVLLEREAQDRKHGTQEHENERWMTILTEEVGEVAAAILQKRFTDIALELIQVTAVALLWLEFYLGNETIAACFESHWTAQAEQCKGDLAASIYEEWKRDPASARPYEEVRGELGLE